MRRSTSQVLLRRIHTIRTAHTYTYYRTLSNLHTYEPYTYTHVTDHRAASSNRRIERAKHNPPHPGRLLREGKSDASRSPISKGVVFGVVYAVLQKRVRWCVCVRSYDTVYNMVTGVGVYRNRSAELRGLLAGARAAFS